MTYKEYKTKLNDMFANKATCDTSHCNNSEKCYQLWYSRIKIISNTYPHFDDMYVKDKYQLQNDKEFEEKEYWRGSE